MIILLKFVENKSQDISGDSCCINCL